MRYRSQEWFQGRDELGFQHRAALRTMGLDYSRFEGRPVIGIANSWSELNNCNMNLRDVAEAVKRGILAANALPLEFPTISLGEEFMKPTSMLYRNLMAMDIEETLRANPLDGVVLLSNCDKTGPAQLMGAASANLPSIQVNGGPRKAEKWRGEEVGSGTDLWQYWDEYRTGRLSAQEWHELEDCMSCGVGACNVMGTASTVAAITEGLGMMLPGSSTWAADDPGRMETAEAAGRRIVSLVEQDIRPRDIMTQGAFDNAIRLCMALGGSTNAIIHLIAIAGRLGIDLPMERFDRLGRETPFLVDVKPSGKNLIHALHAAGGVPAVLKRIEAKLDTSCLTVSGNTLAQDLAGVVCQNEDVVRPLSAPLHSGGAIAVLSGNLAPRGALLKTSAASPALFRHEGEAIVFDGYQDMLARIEDPGLPVTAASVLIMRNCGPKAVPGMPEWGSIPVPRKLQAAGITDVVRISDARMSGTSYGTVILHVCPEGVLNPALSAVRDGDRIRLDVESRTLELLVSDDEIAKRLLGKPVWKTNHLRGYPRLYADHVLQCDEGCDFDFLRPRNAAELEFIPPVVGRS
ncbi:MAG: dihydroxy-acid dehydratase [Acidobacteriaceae bacterium]|nr:dihydroxy-acid dehydratase [Acidobacteriaceae bacterium]